MADPTFEAERLAEIMRQVNEDMLRYGEVTSTTTDAMMKAKYGIANYTQGMNKAGDAVAGLAKAGIAAASAMYEGKKGAAAFNDSLGELSTAATAAGAALALMIPGGIIVKAFIGAITLATTATIGYVKKSNEMADKLYGGFNKLGKAGAVGAEGLTGVYQGAKKLGLSMSELDGYVSMVGENSRDLALLSGSVYRGRQQFEDMGQAMEPFRESLFAAGMTQQDINEASMQYLRLQTRIGATQNLTVNQLAEGARKYLIETDALTKLTGQSRKEQEEALEAARSQQRFRAKLEEMRNSGDAQQVKAADELELTYKMLYQRSKEAAQGFGDLSTGMIGTDAANKLTQSTQADVLDTLERQKRGQIDGIKAFQEVGQSVARVTKQYNMLYQTGVGEETLLKINEGTELGLAANRDLSDEAKKIREEQIRQGLTGAQADDGITAQYGKNIKQQQDLNKKMEDAVFKGIDNALVITNKLGNVTDTLADQFTTLSTAMTKFLNIIGLGPKEDKIKANEEERTKTEAALKAAQEAQLKAKTDAEKQQAEHDVKFYKDKLEVLAKEKITIKEKEENAKLEAEVIKRAEDERKIKQANFDKVFATATFGQKAGFGQTDIQKQARKELLDADLKVAQLKNYASPQLKKEVAAAKAAQPAAPATPGAPGPGARTPKSKGAAPTPGAPAEVKPEDYLIFTGASGSLSAFNQLDSNLRDAVLNAAEDYKNITGKKIQINSAVRDSAKQKELYDAWVAGGRRGVPVAPPGRSLHEQGQAVDIQNYGDRTAVDFMNQEGLYQRVANDPQHFQFRYGGIAKGPVGGYNARLHGTEAVIPLVNGSVPVTLTTKMDFGLDNMKSEFLSAMQDFMSRGADKGGAEFTQSSGGMAEAIAAFRQGAAQTETLVSLVSDLLRAQKDQNDISDRLLQAANS